MRKKTSKLEEEIRRIARIADGAEEPYQQAAFGIMLRSYLDRHPEVLPG